MPIDFDAIRSRHQSRQDSVDSVLTDTNTVPADETLVSSGIDFDAIRSRHQARQSQLNGNVSEAVKINPDQHATNMKLSQESGVPVFAVQSDPAAVESSLKLDKINLEGMTQRSPKTSQFLAANFDTTVIAQEDLADGLLEGIERTFNGLGTSIGTTFDSIGEGAKLYAVESLEGVTKGLAESIIKSQTPDGFEQQAAIARANVDISGAISDEGDRVIAEIQGLQLERQAATPGDLNILQEGVRGGIESIAIMTPGIALGILSGGSATPVLATIGAQTFASAYGDARADGLSPEESQQFAAIDAAIEVGTELLPTKTLQKMLTGKSAGMTKDALKFMVQEMGTEQLATAGQTINSYLHGLDEELENATGVEEIAAIQLRRQAVTAIATVVAGGAQAGTVSAVGKTISKLTATEQTTAQRGATEQETLDSLSADAEKSKLRERDVESFKQFVREADGENTSVFIDSVQTSLYLQGKSQEEIEADPALKTLSNAMTESRVTGVDAVVPIDEFMGDVVGTEHYTQLREHMTLSTDTVSPFRQEQHKVETEAYVDTLMADAQQNASEYVEAQEIYEQVKEQLVDTGKVSTANASVMAQIVPAWATAQAKRTGRTVTEVYESAGLIIEGPQTGEMERLTGEQVLTQQSITEVKEELKTTDDPVRVTQLNDELTRLQDQEQQDAKQDRDTSRETQAREGTSTQATDTVQRVEGQEKEVTLDQLEAGLFDVEGVDALIMSETGNTVEINTISVDETNRNTGVGSQVMARIVTWADANGKTVTLYPAEKSDGGGTTSRARLVKFYKRFGFVENKGRNKDFEISAPMYRVPVDPDIFKQKTTDGVRGYYDPVNSIIRLTESADLSTFLHEFAHFMYEMEAKGNTDMNASINNWYKRNAADVAAEANKYLGEDFSVLKQGGAVTLTTENMYEVLLDDKEDDLQFHGSYDPNLDRVTDGDDGGGVNFGGVFTNGSTTAAESHGPELYAVVIKDNEKAREGSVDLDVIDRDTAVELAEEVFVEDREKLIELVELAIDDDGSSTLQDSEELWNVQRLRGLIAGKLGYKTVEMRDEHGVSTLVLPGAKLHKIQDERFNQSTDQPTGKQGTITADDVVTFLDQTTTGDKAKDAVVRRAVHEQFARGFETYLMEGKAPSIELRNAFRTFARWLARIYQAMRGNLNVKLDTEMRAVFDRLLATEEQIAAAESRARIEPMFTDAAMAGMTEQEFSDYEKRQSKVKDVQSETLRDQMIKALTNKTKKWWKEEKADLIVTETDRLKAEKVYVAGATLRDTDLKLDTATVKEMAGVDKVDSLKRKSRVVSPKLRGMTAKGQTGVHPDEAAAFLGYGSGAEMLTDLIDAPPIKEAAAEAAEALMVERHGDPLTDGTIEQQADEAVQSEERGKLILHELKILSRGTNQRVLDRNTMKSIAKDRIGRLSFRENHPGKYRKAEISAAQEAARLLAEGDKEGAAQAKSRQAMNYFLGMEATEAKNETTKIVDRMARYTKKKVREEIQKAEGGYWEQIVKILERFEFKKSATLKSVDTVNQDINTWAAERMDKDGAGLVLDNVVLNESYVTHWRNVAYSDMRGIDDSVKNIEHVARYSNKITRMGEEIEYNKLVAKLEDAAAAGGTGKFKKSASIADDLSWVQRKGRWAMAQMTKIPYMMSWMDGHERTGVWVTTFSQPFTDAYNTELEMFGEVGKPVMDMIKNRSKADVKRHNTKVFIPEIKDTGGGTHTGNMMGHEILAVALNTGNAGNLKKLLLGEGWADPNNDAEITLQNPKLQAVLAHMTESDWQMVQKIWDQIDILYPKLAEVHRKTTGLAPPKVEATPVETPFGTFNGGYYPVKYDPMRDNKAAEFEERKEAEMSSMFSSNASIQASVNTGSTNERTGYYAPIHLTLNVVPNHIQETIHYITHHNAVREVNQLLRDSRIKKAVSEKLGPEEFAQLKPWLNDIAKDGRNAPNKSLVDAMFNQLRLGTTLGVMGFKASTGIIQISGLSNTIAEVGLTPVLQASRTILGSPKTMQSAWEFATEKSKVLKHRTVTMDREIMNAMQQLASRRGKLAVVQETSMKHIAYIQTYMVDLPSWHAAYIKELGQSGDEAKAIQYADWVIENVQGSGATKDMAALMRNQTKTHTIFTMFMTFFSALWNLERDTVKGVKGGQYSTSTVAAKLMFLVAVPVLFEMLMRGKLGGEDEEPEEQLQKYMTEVALFPVQSVPFVRDIVNGVAGGYGYNASPVTAQIEKGLQGIEGISKAVLADGDMTKSQVKNANKLIGAALGVPGTGQAWASGEHLYDVIEEGEDFTVHQLLFGPKRD